MFHPPAIYNVRHAVFMLSGISAYLVPFALFRLPTNIAGSISRDFACRAIPPAPFRTISLAGDHALCRICDKEFPTWRDQQESARGDFP
jgi:hypothetical protein